MLRFEKQSTKNYSLYNDDKFIIPLPLITSTVTNKYYIITKFIENISAQFGSEFDEWIINLLSEIKRLHLEKEIILKHQSENPNELLKVEIEGKFVFLQDNIDKLKYYVDEYIEKLDMDYSDFVNMKKVKKDTILFLPEEIKTIIRASGYLKLYSLVSNSEYKLGERLHKKIYNMLIGDMIGDTIISKIYNIVKTKTFRYKLTDKYMWDYLKAMQSKTIDSYVVEIFNFIMDSILILCETDRNPIVYFIGVVDESVKWFLRSVYKGSIVYDDSISTEDIHGMNVDNLMTYAYNDTLGRLKGFAIKYLYNEIEKNEGNKFEDNQLDVSITTVQNRISNIQYISPVTEYLVYPILAQALDIPYTHFKTLNAEHSSVLSVYMKHIYSQYFSNDYNLFFNLLDYYSQDIPLLYTTYKIKSINIHINNYNNYQNFFGFKTPVLLYDMLSHFVGKIARCNFINIYTGVRLDKLQIIVLESQIISFYTRLFAGKFKDEIKKIGNVITAEF